MNQKRLIGLDMLKIYATMMVLFLHIDSFVMSQFGESSYPGTTLLLYFFMEAIAYPAIHLFVMAGSWFMIDKVNPLKQISKIWSQTWIVTMVGLIASIAIFKQLPSIVGGYRAYSRFSVVPTGL